MQPHKPLSKPKSLDYRRKQAAEKAARTEKKHQLNIGESVWDTYFRIGKLIEAGVYPLSKGGTLTVKPRKSGATQTFVGYPKKGGKPGRTAHASGRAGVGAKSTDKPVQRVLAHADETGKSSVKDTTPK